MLSNGLRCFRYTKGFREVIGQKYCTASELQNKRETTTAAEFDFNSARPSEEIPGPSKFELVRNILPGGVLHNKPITDMLIVYGKKYGQLFRMPGLFGNRDFYVTSNPDDYSVIFRNEGQWPVRRTFDTFVYHRKVHRAKYFQGVEGLLAGSGEKWYNVRKVANPVLMQPRNVRPYLTTMLDVNDEFLERIRKIRNPKTLEMPDSFEEEINRLALESVAAVALNTRLGLINRDGLEGDSKAIISNLRSVFDMVVLLEGVPFWKIIKTPGFYKMMKVLDAILDDCNKYIELALEKIEKDKNNLSATELNREKCVLEKLAQEDKKIAVTMALDMLFAGVDTTSSALAGILAVLAKNPQKQEKLYEEMKTILPEKHSRLTIDNMSNLPYLRACIKEGLRLHPILPGTMRQLPHDVVLSGYRVPGGNDITTAGNAQMRDENYVPRAKEYIPERWLRNDVNNKFAGDIVRPFMYLPFGFGPRSCAGRRVVELEMEITIARLVRNFIIEFNHPVENLFTQKMIVVPNKPLNFKFEERKE